MTIYTINQKTSGTGSIHDLASDLMDIDADGNGYGVNYDRLEKI